MQEAHLAGHFVICLSVQGEQPFLQVPLHALARLGSCGPCRMKMSRFPVRFLPTQYPTGADERSVSTFCMHP